MSGLLLIRKLSQGGSVARKPGSGRPTKVTQQVKDLIEEQMQTDDRTTAAELKHMLEVNGIKHYLALPPAAWVDILWFGILPREPNKYKQLSWCLEN